MKKDEAYIRAEKRVRAKIGFYYHLTSYLIVNLTLVFIWYFTGAGYQWFWWPMMGWGIGLLFHAANLFLSKSTFMDRMIQRELKREKERESRKGS
ncbi:MAG: 2TM domain-containing protein [Deltaproteobacteria bacterium]|uniref:2TM domain-containing protein n=1 Tax=Candidatus Zymogenus saltonus TaxID=2844893 RepID=A0A9D8PJI1_9DELT|nr:2TM domain-containing protein [Candidatus Zymogenus saltonus]